MKDPRFELNKIQSFKSEILTLTENLDGLIVV